MAQRITPGSDTNVVDRSFAIDSVYKRPVTQKSWAMRAGTNCHFCKKGVLEYSGMLALNCPVCGFTQGGCFT